MPIQHPRNIPFWEIFGPFLPQYGPANKNNEEFLKDSIIYGKF